MTGRDLILYILLNDLEDAQVFENGKFIGFITIGEAAEKMEVGIATMRVWINQGIVEAYRIGEEILIPANFKLKEAPCTKVSESSAL